MSGLNEEQARRLVQNAVAQAKSAQGRSVDLFGAHLNADNHHLLMYAVAAVVAVAVYFLLKCYKPEFVLAKKNGEKHVDEMRAVISAVVAGLLVVLVYHLVDRH